MSRPGSITSAVVGMILCLAILMTPSWLYALTDNVYGDDDEREPWLGPGDPEGGDRSLELIPVLETGVATRSGADIPGVPGERDTPPLIRLIPIRDGYLLIIGSGKSLQAYPLLLSR